MTAKSSAPLQAIKGYTFKPREIVNYGHWDPKTKTLTPLSSTTDDDEHEDIPVHVVLDTLVLATEAGVIRKFDWAQQLFANVDTFEEFIDELREYDECYRITDQWWQAIAEVSGGAGDEEGLVLCSEMADELFKSASAFGRIGNFGRKPDAYYFEYTLEQCEKAQLDSHKKSASHGAFLSNKKDLDECYLRCEFAAYYDLDISTERYKAAHAEGVAMLSDEDKPAKAKAAAKKAAKSK